MLFAFLGVVENVFPAQKKVTTEKRLRQSTSGGIPYRVVVGRLGYRTVVVGTLK